MFYSEWVGRREGFEWDVLYGDFGGDVFIDKCEVLVVMIGVGG